MSLTFNMVGGNSSKVVGFVSTIYPEGSTCVCTNGVKVLKAQDTSGKWVFPIPETGAWTVSSTANDGSGDSASETVEITTEGQSEKIFLSYPFYLVRNGVINEEYVFEKYHGESTAITTDGVLTVAIQTNDYSSWFTAEKIPLADFSRAVIDIAGGVARYDISFGVTTARKSFSTTNGSPFGTNRVAVKNPTEPYTFAAQTLNFDLSGFSEPMYFGFSVAGAKAIDDPKYGHSGLDIINIALLRR